MFDWLLDKVPLWLWIVVAAVALVAAWRLLGFRGMLAAVAAIVTVGVYRAGRQSGGADALARQENADQEAVKDHEQIEDETGRMSDAELDAANDPWVRKHRRGR